MAGNKRKNESDAEKRANEPPVAKLPAVRYSHDDPNRPLGYDPEKARLVAQLASYCLTIKQIAIAAKIRIDFVKDIYGEDYEMGRVIGIGSVSRNMMRIASVGDGSAAVQAGVFVLLTQGGWSKAAPEDMGDDVPEVAAIRDGLEAKIARYTKRPAPSEAEIVDAKPA